MSFEIREGASIPSVTFKTRNNHEWVDLTSDDLFRDKTVIVFSLPGAFTPTCSSTHVPRYNQLAPMFKAHDIDEVICMSVNDAFVMNQWQVEQKADNLRFIPDGSGDFTRAMGMLVRKDDLGFGERSWRYSMLVRNSVVEKMFIEPELPGDPFQVSDADSMAAYLGLAEKKPLDVTVFSRPGCPHCVRAKGLLADCGIDFDELVLNQDYRESTLRAVAGGASVPQIFIDGRLIGGADDLESHLGLSNAA